MKLVSDLGGACLLCNKRLDLLQLALVPVLKPRRIVKNELWVACESERSVDFMDPSLTEQYQRGDVDQRKDRPLTSSVGFSLLSMNCQRMPFCRLEWKTYQVVPSFVIDAWLLCRVANSFQESRLTGIGPPNDEDTEMTVFLSKSRIVQSASHCGSEQVGEFGCTLVMYRESQKDRVIYLFLTCENVIGQVRCRIHDPQERIQSIRCHPNER